ncbi:YrhB domain-containing protein [Microbacterium sp. SLBN-111]|uniref:YrhB domain-containing protein n=1 Tax=Microbacterium sp. SLBN-111 TaxID=3377733 RepID=UPI003C769F76
MTDPRQPPLTAQEAEQVALRFLARSTEEDGIPRIILGPAVEAGPNWVFYYQGRGYVERGDLDEMLLGNMPIVVPRAHSAPYPLSPLEDIDVQMRRMAHDAD